jgi:hypothetical protein
MEVECYDSNEKNNGYISNVQDKIFGRESMLAKTENATKSKLLVLSIDPTTGKPHTCNNYHWQGSAHTDTNICLVWATKLLLAAMGLVFPALVLGYKSFNCSIYQVPVPMLFG